MAYDAWYRVTYADGTYLAVLTRDEAVRISNSDNAVYGSCSEVTGPYPEEEARAGADFTYLP